MPGFVIAILALAGLIASIVMVLTFFGFRFRSRLRQHPHFTPPAGPSAALDPIVYTLPEHPTLAAFREKHDLESVAGQGTEMERLARLMRGSSGDISESALLVKVKVSRHLLCKWSLQPLVR